jgi:hypothetical protein
MIIIVVILLAVVGGGLVWYFMSGPGKGEEEPDEEPEEDPDSSNVSASYKGFTSGTMSSTPFDADGVGKGGDITFLDRHTVDCNGKPVNYLKLERNPTVPGQWQYKYKCAAGGDLGAPVGKNTTFNDIGGRDISYLDRHDVKCEDNSVMTKVHFANDKDYKNIRWDYSCAPNKQTKKLACRDVKTPVNERDTVNRQNAHYLDRHELKCNDDEALSQFQMINDENYSKIHFNYKCCK